MKFDKRLMLKALSALPWIGWWFHYKYCQMVMGRLDELSQQFSSPMVRFATIIHGLYDVLKEARMPLEEDFEWLSTLLIPINTKTSEEACRLLEALLLGRGIKVSEAFRSREPFEPIEVLDWYSNKESVDQFYEHGLLVMQAYCDKNPIDPDWEDVSKPTVNWTPPVINFISSLEFKLFVHDMIAVTRLILQSQTR